MSGLRIDWLHRRDAERAVMRWHYSRRMPKFKLACLGVWEGGKWIGAVIFGCGATPEIGMPFGVKQWEACELVRVALGPHQCAVSRVVAICQRMIVKRYPRLRVIVSFADESQGHVGGIYQALGWIYVGRSRTDYITVGGVVVHPKTLHSRYGIGGQSIPWLRKNVDPNARRVAQYDKHKYVLPICDDVRRKLKPLPYPKRAGSADGGTASDQLAGDGSNPIPALSQVSA